MIKNYYNQCLICGSALVKPQIDFEGYEYYLCQDSLNLESLFEQSKSNYSIKWLEVTHYGFFRRPSVHGWTDAIGALIEDNTLWYYKMASGYSEKNYFRISSDNAKTIQHECDDDFPDLFSIEKLQNFLILQ